MAHCNTILSQILKLVPRHEFETLAMSHSVSHSVSHSGHTLLRMLLAISLVKRESPRVSVRIQAIPVADHTMIKCVSLRTASRVRPAKFYV